MSEADSVTPTSAVAVDEKNVKPTEWKSCCFTLHPQILLFITQVFFSAFLIFFSAFKLLAATPPDPLYVSMLTTTVGVWLPSPLHQSAKGGTLTT